MDPEFRDKIIQSWWKHGFRNPCIGFVLIETMVGVRKLYFGAVEGKDQKLDEQEIATYGHKMTPLMMAEMFGKLIETDKFE